MSPRCCIAASESAPHAFHVRAIRHGRATARADFSWTVLEPKPFTVAPRPEAVGPLYPGEPAEPDPGRDQQPEPGGDHGHRAEGERRWRRARLRPGRPTWSLTAPALASGLLRIAAHGSVSLPSGKVAAPTIALRELPISQDACKSANFKLAFSGSAGR